jgi:biopolymer transport protein ExbD
MSASLSNAANAEPNLTPMLDMVFQLITFFMLVINFKSASMDLSLKLPVIGSARPVDMKGADELLVLNIDALGRLVVYGEYKEVDKYIANEAFVSLIKARAANPKLQPGDELPTNVVIRADRAVPFKLLNHVIKTCQDRGFRRFSLKAMNKE